MKRLTLVILPLLVACTSASQEGVHEYGCDLAGITYEVMNDNITVLKCKEPSVVIMCKTETFQVSGSEYKCEDAKGTRYRIQDKTTTDAKTREYLESLGY